MSELVTIQPYDPVGPMPRTPTAADALKGRMWDLGFDPDVTQAVILTPTRAVAVAASYPEPYRSPKAATK